SRGKAKAKLEYKAKKDFVHSVRYLLFALQLLHKGRIYDYGAANDLWYETRDNPIDWKKYHQKHEEVFNLFKDDFRTLSVQQDKFTRHFYSVRDTLLKSVRNQSRVNVEIPYEG